MPCIALPYWKKKATHCISFHFSSFLKAQLLASVTFKGLPSFRKLAFVRVHVDR